MLTVVHALSSPIVNKLHKATVIQNKHISYTFCKELLRVLLCDKVQQLFASLFCSETAVQCSCQTVLILLCWLLHIVH